MRPDATVDPAALFDEAPCGYAVLDASGLILKANRHFLDLVGYARADIESVRELPALLPVGARIYYETHLHPMLMLDQKVHEVALELVRADGDRVPVLLSAAARHDEGVTQVLAVVFEARHRRQYENDLLESTKRAEAARAETAALAQMLQATLIPPVPPLISGLEIAAAYRPAGDGSEVGGDFYDVFQVGSEEWMIVLGDVSGKGVTAGLVTAFVRHTVRALAMQEPRPAELLHRLNGEFLAHPTDKFCTLVVARLRKAGDNWHLTCSAAGHPLPLVCSREGIVSELGLFGSPLGLLEEPTFHNAEFTLTDESVMLYTDGVTEARSDHELFGEKRLLELISRLPRSVAARTSRVVAAVLEFQDDDPRDDIAVLTFSAVSPTESDNDSDV